MQISIKGYADLKQVQAQFAAVTQQVESMNHEMAKTTMIPAGGNPQNFRRIQSSLNAANTAFNTAVASSGAFRMEQIKIGDVVERNTELLQKQKLSFRDVFGSKNRNLMKAMYKEQLALQRAQAGLVSGATNGANRTGTLMVPTASLKTWDTLSNRMGFFRAQLASASKELINWGKNTQWAGRQLMAGISYPIAALGAVAGTMTYQMDKAMAQITKVYDFTAAAQNDEKQREKEIADLRDKSMTNALKNAQSYGASMKSTLDIEQQLAATGLKGKNLFETTNQVQRIATLGDIDPQKATDMIISLGTAFRKTIKPGQDMTNVLNFMNAASNATSLSLDDIAEATPKAATAISQLGGTAQEMTILLVSMREAGVNAAQGANALKSATTRIINPVKKAVDFYGQWGINLESLAKESGGDFFTYLKLLGKEQQKIVGPTDKQTKLLREQGLAALFGTYQLNRLNASLVNIGDAYAGVHNQTSKAMDLMGESTEDLAKTADNSMRAIQESVSNRFKSAIATLQIELADAGQPFLEIGTFFAELFTKGLKLFNAMPGWAKKASVLGLIIAAMVGPVVMLVGLLANFAGNIVRVVAALAGAGSRFELLNKQQVLTRIQTSLLNSEFLEQVDTTTALNNQIRALSLGIKEYAAAVKTTTGLNIAPGAFNPLTAATIAEQARSMPTSEEFVAPAAAGSRLSRITGVIRQNMASAAIPAAAMATSMALMVTPSGEVGHNIGQWLMIATIALPAAKALFTTFARMVPALEGMTGPIGWAAAALTGIGVIAYKIMSHEKEITAEKRAQNRALYDQNNLMAKQLKIRPKSLDTLSTLTAADMPGQTTVSDLARQMQADSTMKPLIDSMKNANSETERATIASTKYIQVLRSTGGNAQKAERYVTALYIAAGDNALTASKKASDFMRNLGTSIDPREVKDMYSRLFSAVLTSDDMKSWQEQGTRLGKMLADSIANGSHAEAPKIMEGFEASIDSGWTTVFDKLDENTRAQLKQYGVTSGVQLRKMIKQYDEYTAEAAKGKANAPKFAKQFGVNAWDNKDFLLLTDTIHKASFAAGPLEENEKAVTKELASQLGITGDITTLAQLRNTWEWKLQTATKGNFKNLYDQRVAQKELANGSKDLTTNQKIEIANDLRRNIGLKDANNLTVALTAGLEDTAAVSGQAAAETKKIVDNLKDANAIHVQIKVDDISGIMQTSMSAVEDEIATNAQNSFQRSMDSAISAYNKTWDKRKRDLENSQQDAMDKLTEAQKRQTTALDNEQSRQDDAFNARWDRRKQTIQDYYDARIKATQKAINAEEKAEAIRQKIFEAEQTRLERGATSANQTIDFNVALQTGSLDEAAKIRNDMEAQAAEWALSDAANTSSTASDKKKTRLQHQQDTLKKERDGELKNLAKIEAAQKTALKRRQKFEDDALKTRQEHEKEALKRQQKMQTDALKYQTQAAEKAYKQEWDARKANLDDELDLFKSYVPRSKTELQHWINQMRGQFSDFGNHTLDPMSDKWAGFFNTHFRQQIRKAGAAVASDNMWAHWGKKEALSTLQGFGFPNMNAFEHFVSTGKLPKNFGAKPAGTKPKGGTPGDNTPLYHGAPGAQAEWRHEGGMVGSGGGSRKGVARNLRGLHRNEIQVNAQKGEYVWDRKTTAKNRDIIEGIHTGVFDPMNGREEKAQTMGGFSPNVPGLAAGVMMRMFAAGISNTIGNAVKKQLSTGTSFAAPGAGTYGDITFTADQLNNAATIASVGRSMGMSSRDVEIGIMTAITESSLRNISYGDRDSLGLFQQRPSQGWGSPAQVTNPTYAARKFFESLRGVGDRANMAPWLAAQAVQRSAYSDGSNYARYWNEATSIFRALRVNASAAPGGYVAGPGGRHRPINRPVTNGLHDQYTGYPAVDFSTPVGTPIYAVADGVVSRSYDIKGYEPRRAGYGKSQDGYRSYGKVIYLKTNAGPEVLYAHLSQRGVVAGTRVAGGSIIGKSGDTGNSTGPHLHFGSKGASPMAWLKKGGMTLNDGIAALHRGETVLTKPLSKDLKDAVSAMGGAGRALKNAPGWRSSLYQADKTSAGTGWTWLDNSLLSKRVPGAQSQAAPTPVSVSPNGGGNVVRIGTYNVKFNSKNASTRADLTKLMPRTDTLGLNEMSTGAKRSNILPWLNKHGWGTYGAKGDSVLTWNRSKVSMLRGGQTMINKRTAATMGGQRRWATYGLFKNKSSGRRYWQISAHTIPRAYNYPRIQQEQFGNLTKLYKRLKGSAPVILTGDLNQDLRRGKINIGNLKSNWAGHMGHGNYTDGRSYLDHLMAAFGPRSQQVVKGLASDHNAVLASYNIPSLAKGAENIKWDNTLINAHKGESVLTEDLSKKFKQGVDNFANGGGITYNVPVTIQGNASEADAKAIAGEVIKVIRREESRKPQKRTNR